MVTRDDIFRSLREKHFAGASVRFEPGTPKTETLGAAAVVQVLGPNPNRVAWAIVNKGGEVVHVDFSRAVSATRGFVLPASNGTMVSRYEEDGDTVFADVFAFATAGSDVYVVAWEVQP